ncbi:MAG: trigger factor [Ignavibacteria bacterium]|nr:trigger factor [Ignavibacteria bacterium]
MDLTLNDLENSKKELVAELSYEELTPHFEKAIEKYRKKASIPGFRKGKAPLNMIKKLYGEGIEYSSLEDIANEIFVNYLVENKLDLLSKAAITDLDYKPKEKFSFKVEFEIMPEIKVDNYKGLELKKTKYIIDDSRVDDEIQYHRFRHATNEIDGVALDDNYIVTVDLQNLDEAGNIIIGQSQKDLKVYLGNPQIFPEFKEGFKGIKEGEVRIIDSKNAEGGPKKVQITCTKVEKIVLPEMNEEFFRKVTNKEEIKTEEDFKQEIKNEIQKIYDGVSDRKIDTDAISEMIKTNDIPAPERYVQVILNGMIEEYKHQYPKQQLPKDFDEEEFKRERRVDAILQAKWYLIREKMIEDHNIKVEEEDYTKIAEENASRYNIPAEKLIEAYKDNEDVKMKILNDKVLDLIISNASIEEKEEVLKKEDQQGTESD